MKTLKITLKDPTNHRGLGPGTGSWQRAKNKIANWKKIMAFRKEEESYTL